MHRDSTHGCKAVPGMKMHPPYFVMPISGLRSPRSSSDHGLLLSASCCPNPIRQKGCGMKLKVRYENEYQTIELDDAAAEQLWLTLSLENRPAGEEKEKTLQEAWEEQFNKPDYNNWHKHDRHTDPNPKCRRMDGKRGYVQGDPDDASFDIMDYLLTTSGHEGSEADSEYQETCDKVRRILARKPEWADAVIAVMIDGESIRGYAARTGADENSVSKKLKRAGKKLRKYYEGRKGREAS